MTHADFHAAMLADPDDDVLRLVFADWLDERGEADRAAWVRLGVRADRTTKFGERVDLMVARTKLFTRCRPDYFTHITGIDADDSRGTVWLVCKSKAALKRLQKTDWLGRAFAEAWLAGVRVRQFSSYLTDSVEAAWAGGARGLPLGIEEAAQITDSEFHALAGLPTLVVLELPAHALRNAATAHLAACKGLTNLALELRFVEDADADRVLAAVRQLPRLRHLTLIGSDHLDYARRPTTADLMVLAAVPSLRTIRLTNCSNITADDFAAVEAALPGVTVTRSG